MHYLTLVICDEGNSIERLLAPFDERLEVDEYLDLDGDPTTCNPQSQWDWYEIGGRWGCQMAAKRGLTGADASLLAFRGETTPQAIADSVGCRLPTADNGNGFLCDVAMMDDVTIMPHAYSVLTPDGEWHDRQEIRLVKQEDEEGRPSYDIEVIPDETWDDDFERRFVEPYLGQGCAALIIDRHI